MAGNNTIEGHSLSDLENNQKNPYVHVLRQILKEKRDTEQFLRRIAPQYLGVYVLDKETDFFRDIVGPDYFRKIVKEKNGCYSEALKIYGRQFVLKEDQPVIEQVLDYDWLYGCLWSGQQVVVSYRKTDGTLVKLEIARYSDQEDERNLSLWIYSDEGVEYKKQLGMDNNATNILHSAVTTGLWCIEYDENGDISQCIWSNAFRKILGYESVVELPDTWAAWVDKIHPDDLQFVNHEYEKAQNDYSGMTNYDIEYRMHDRQGVYHWFRDTAHFSRRSDGTPICANGLVVLMDEKHEMEAKLMQTLQKEQKQRKMMEALSVDYTAVFECDLLNDIIYAVKMKESSHSFHNREHIHSFSKWIQYTYEHVIIKESTPDFLKIFNRTYLMEYFTQHDSLITRHRTIPDSNGNEYFEMRVIPVYREVSDYKVMLAYRPIDDIVRSEKKQQEQLSIALTAAEQSSRAKTTFLNSMSHDIRTPMNAIIGFTALAQTHIDDTEQVQAYLTKINTSGAHLLSLINDILDMSCIESGSIRLDEKPVYVPELIDDLRSMVQGMADEKGQNLCIDVQNVQNENIITDKLRLNQILLNIISNAIKFTPEGGDIAVCLTEKPCPRRGFATYEFTIKDTGIGMSEQFVNHVFDAFARERSSTVSGIQGTGLGMAIAKNIAEMMGGRIKVESQEGKGSLFTVTLDMKLADKPAEYEYVPSDRPVPKQDYSGRRILLVEDNELNREIATEILKETGMKIDCAGDGIDAVNIINESPANKYDLVFMDIQMPKMDGYTATREIRTLPDKVKANIPIVAMTANAFEEDKRKSYESGMNGHISKPITIEAIFKVLNDIFAENDGEKK